jgi:hypothetical protein
MGHLCRTHIPQRIKDLRRKARVSGLDKIWERRVNGAINAFLQRLADFPMVSEGIDDSSHAPTIGLVGNGLDHGGARFYRPCEHGIGILHDHHHPHRTPAH